MGWADDMYDGGYTSTHGGLMDDHDDYYNDECSLPPERKKELVAQKAFCKNLKTENESWMERLWQWADLNGIDDRIIPRSAYELTQLRYLWLGNPNLNELPKEIGMLTKVRFLYLRGSNRNKLPKVIEQFTQLKTLTLDKNTLRGLSKKQEEWLSELERNGCRLWANNNQRIF
jgi:Leucine-rich repeat (LRR) protein